MTRDRYTLADWVLVLNFESLISSCFVSHCFWLLFIKLQPFSLCWENFEELSIANWYSLFKVSYVLFQNFSVMLFKISFLSFISKLYSCTALPCLFFVISFRCCWVEFPRRYRSCLLARGNISRLALCLVRIALKLRRFRKPTFMGLKSGTCCKYLTSIS